MRGRVPRVREQGVGNACVAVAYDQTVDRGGLFESRIKPDASARGIRSPLFYVPAPRALRDGEAVVEHPEPGADRMCRDRRASDPPGRHRALSRDRASDKPFEVLIDTVRHDLRDADETPGPCEALGLVCHRLFGVQGSEFDVHIARAIRRSAALVEPYGSHLGTAREVSHPRGNQAGLVGDGHVRLGVSCAGLA